MARKTSTFEQPTIISRANEQQYTEPAIPGGQCRPNN